MSIIEGRYVVWFRTPIGEAAGVVQFEPNGELSGGDSTFAYKGNWSQQAQRFKAGLTAKRVSPGPPGVFGKDEIDIVVTGVSLDGAPVSCTGFAKQSPGLTLEVTLTRLRDGD